MIERSPTMKNNISRIFAIVAIAVIGLCASPKPAAAQDSFKGHFTLTETVRWNGANLPAGEYDFTLQSMSTPSRILLHGPNGYALVLTGARSEKMEERASSLTIEHRGGSTFISQLYLAELGVELRYSAPKLPNNEIAQGPSSTEQVLVAMTTK
jgi:hypothetical protein